MIRPGKAMRKQFKTSLGSTALLRGAAPKTNLSYSS
jgi:hypothetical protein